MVKTIIRFASKKDLKACVKLALERDSIIKEHREPKFWDNLFGELINQKRILVSFFDQKLVGFAYFSNFLYDDNNNLYVQLVWIKEEYRRKGIGKLFYKKIEQIAKTKGATKLFSSCDYDNYPSLKMHKSLGFRKCGYIKNLGKNGEKEIFFSKKI